LPKDKSISFDAYLSYFSFLIHLIKKVENNPSNK